MPFLEGREDFLPAYINPTRGVPSEAQDVFLSSFRAQRYRESTLGHADLFEQEYAANNEVIKSLTGEADARNYLPAAFSVLAREMEGMDAAGYEDVIPEYEALKTQGKKLDELKKRYPQVKTFGEMWQSAKKRSEAIGYEQFDSAERATTLGKAAGFAGAMAGSFTKNDPLNLVSLGFGGWGRTAAARVASEFGINTGVEAVNQFTGASLNRKLLGVEDSLSKKAQNVFFAGAGAAVFRGGIEAAPPLYRNIEARIFPQKALGRQLNDVVDKTPLSALQGQEGLQKALSSLAPKSSDARAADAGVRLDREFEKANFLGESREASLVFEGEASRVFSEITGVPFSRGDTAAGRVLSGRGAPVVHLEGADTAIAKAVEEEARRASPEIFKELDEANARLETLETEMSSLRGALASRSVGDVVAIVDEATGARVKSIEKELEGVIPRKRRQDLERELDSLVANFDGKALEKVEKDFQIGPRKHLKDINAKLRNARRDFKDAKTKAEAVVSGIGARKKAERNLSRALRTEKRIENFRKNMDEGAPEFPVRRLPVSEVVRIIDETIEQADKFPAVDRARAAAKAAKADEEGMVDLGFGPIPENFSVAVGLSKGAKGEEAISKTVKELLEDILDDEKLVEQIKVCSLL